MDTRVQIEIRKILQPHLNKILTREHVEGIQLHHRRQSTVSSVMFNCSEIGYRLLRKNGKYKIVKGGEKCKTKD